MAYLKIHNLYKDQTILLFKEVWALEKVDGTSSHISWNGSQVHIFAGGVKHEDFIKLFDEEKLKNKFIELFGNKEAIIYGEAYGGKIQKMSHTYGPNLKFIVFDVKVGGHWLNVPDAEQVAKSFELEFVHYSKVSTNIETLDKERDADSVQAVRNLKKTGCIREGIVIRPLVEMTTNNGERVIAKYKAEAFKERQHQPKIQNPNTFQILTKAKEIVNEFVVPMRLNHILQKFPSDVNIEQTSDIIKAMIEDISVEAKNEIIETKQVRTAIGQRTAQLFKEYLKDKLYE